MPIAKKPSLDEPLKAGAPDQPASPIGSARSQLLERIANSLQVPAATFYCPPNAVEPGAQSTAALAVSERPEVEDEALLHAYRRIRDPETRRRLLVLVQAAADRT